MPAYWYDRSVRALLPILLVACTFNGRGPDPVTKPPPPDPDRMPAEVLDKQDLHADTSKNPILSRSEAHSAQSDGVSQWLGCLRLLSCSAGTGGDTSGALIVIAVLAAIRRRNRS
jgi:MYXO-CTERM domain-containing protein